MGLAGYLVHVHERLEYTAAGHHGGAGRTGLVEVRPVSVRMRYEVPLSIPASRNGGWAALGRKFPPWIKVRRPEEPTCRNR